MGVAMLAPVVLAGMALAQEGQISREDGGWSEVFTGSLNGVKNLRVKLDVGGVVVRGGQQAGISYTLHLRSRSSSEEEARRELQGFKLSSYVKGDTAWVVGEWQGDHSYHLGGLRISVMKDSHKFSGELVVQVPRGLDLVRMETGGGNLDATGVAGRVEAQSGGGNLQLDDIGAGARAETGGGSIEVGTISGDANLHTGGGSIEVRRANGVVTAETGGGSVEIGSAAGDANLHTGGGSIEVRQCGGKIRASTGGGSIDLGEMGGPAEIQTGGGTIHLVSAKGMVEARTGGGGIELDGVPSARAETGAGEIVVKLIKTGGAASDSRLETSAGDITVYIARDVAVSVRASVDMGNGHHITSDFADIHVAGEGSQWGPRTLNAEGRLNGGGPVLKVRTSTGDICFKHAN
jgi:DUF4097 and DUF4098 domain-containing protein YvlB